MRLVGKLLVNGMLQGCESHDMTNANGDVNNYFTCHFLNGWESNDLTIDKDLVKVVKPGKYYLFLVDVRENKNGQYKTSYKIINAAEVKENENFVSRDRWIIQSYDAAPQQ